MNKIAYLNELRARLVSIPLDEREAAVKFYEEFFEDAGEENEQAVIADLGSPTELAKSIISDQSAYSRNEDYLTYKQSGAAQSIILDENKSEDTNSEAFGQSTAEAATSETVNTPKSRNTVLLVLLIIFLGIPICSIAVSLITSIIAVLLSWGIVCAVLIIVGIMLAAGGVAALFSSPAEGIALIGAGLLLAGIGLLMLIPFILCIWKFLPFCFVQTGKFFKYLGRKLNGI